MTSNSVGLVSKFKNVSVESMVDGDSSKVPHPVKTILVLLNSRRVKGWSWTIQVRINRVV